MADASAVPVRSTAIRLPVTQGSIGCAQAFKEELQGAKTLVQSRKFSDCEVSVRIEVRQNSCWYVCFRAGKVMVASVNMHQIVER
jgi:hypothetical protein